MENVKMVITDMDGTLLNSNHEVSSKFFEIFKKLKQQNIKFVAASGRPYYSITEKLKSIKNDITIVAENGGLVIKNDELLVSNTLSTKNLIRLIETVDTLKNTFPLYCTKHKVYIKRASEEMIAIFSEYYTNYTIIDSIEEIKDEVIKIALYHPLNSETNIYPFVKHLSTEFSVVVSGNHWVDISDKITNKGHAIRFLQKYYNISPDETMAFGDYNNDFEMLQCATYSYAMENAHDNIKAIANYKTKSNDAFGVESVLEQLIF
ncbi:HAD family hydrolase [Lacinutrix sp. C3R15]|uniref:HAD family hydrolase n=1 Tax=Flavobacteriaceae TaxID=49546 RepID=UPI001C093601|nr:MULTISPECIES: HAD family hydrolase [Flavobacteriaceae]MBU2938374.1 HAD family hydrolase [Lacinutrix sp. C3R15]MDO6621689.1 HAD family hydrolase [Oceanihabitans sp. 1_MG-2023]